MKLFGKKLFENFYAIILFSKKLLDVFYFK